MPRYNITMKINERLCFWALQQLSKSCGKHFMAKPTRLDAFFAILQHHLQAFHPKFANYFVSLIPVFQLFDGKQYRKACQQFWINAIQIYRHFDDWINVFMSPFRHRVTRSHLQKFEEIRIDTTDFVSGRFFIGCVKGLTYCMSQSKMCTSQCTEMSISSYALAGQVCFKVFHLSQQDFLTLKSLFIFRDSSQTCITMPSSISLLSRVEVVLLCLPCHVYGVVTIEFSKGVIPTSRIQIFVSVAYCRDIALVPNEYVNVTKRVKSSAGWKIIQ